MKKILSIQILGCISLLIYAIPLNAQISTGTSGIAIPSNLYCSTSPIHNELDRFSFFGMTQSSMGKSEKNYLKKPTFEKKITRGTYSLSLSME